MYLVRETSSEELSYYLSGEMKFELSQTSLLLKAGEFALLPRLLKYNTKFVCTINRYQFDTTQHLSYITCICRVLSTTCCM